MPGSMRFLRASWHWPRPTTPRWPAAIWLNPHLWWPTLCCSGLFHADALCCGRARGRGTCSMRLELSVELRRAWCSWTSSPQGLEKGRGLLMCRNQCKARSPLICIRNHVSHRDCGCSAGAWRLRPSISATGFRQTSLTFARNREWPPKSMQVPSRWIPARASNRLCTAERILELLLPLQQGAHAERHWRGGSEPALGGSCRVTRAGRPSRWSTMGENRCSNLRVGNISPEVDAFEPEPPLGQLAGQYAHRELLARVRDTSSSSTRATAKSPCRDAALALVIGDELSLPPRRNFPVRSPG